MEPIFDDLLKERNPQVAGLVLLGDGNSFYQVFSFYFEKFRAQNFPFYGFQKTAGLDSLPELLRRMMGDDFSLPPGWVASPDFQYLREKQNLKFLHAQHPGKILKSARTALGLTQKQLVDAAKKMGVPMTIQRYSKIETDRGGGRQIGATDWYYLCQLLEIHTESISYGYEPSIHLQRVRYAIEKGTYRLPLTKVILKNLNQTDLQVFAEPTLQKKQSQK
jgi:transcriptional regulator with XRE-family HTH domain